jgi:hypothetical protein
METPITIRIKRRSPSPPAYDPSADLAEALRIFTEMNDVMDSCKEYRPAAAKTIFAGAAGGRTILKPTETQKVALRRLYKEWCAIVPKMERYNEAHGIKGATPESTVKSWYKFNTGKDGSLLHYEIV